jgi:hypothetical protein
VTMMVALRKKTGTSQPVFIVWDAGGEMGRRVEKKKGGVTTTAAKDTKRKGAPVTSSGASYRAPTVSKRFGEVLGSTHVSTWIGCSSENKTHRVSIRLSNTCR